MPLARDVILVYMRGHSEPICGSCLSKHTGLPPVRVVDGLRDLTELDSDYEVRSGYCTDCRETADVLNRVSAA